MPPEFSTIQRDSHGKFSSRGNGFPTFISHQELIDQYLHDDTLIFEVTEVVFSHHHTINT